MFALIRTYEGLSVENRDEATRKANESLRTILKQSPGFVSYELLKQDGADGKVASISIFDSRAEAQASNEVAQKWVRENLPFMANPHETAGELVTH
jgi:heme-degrading monooxygenase HmoA